MGEQLDLDPALGVFQEMGVAAEAAGFNEEIGQAWEELETIIARLGNIEDITDSGMRQHLSPKLHYINEQLAEIKEYLAGKELSEQVK